LRAVAGKGYALTDPEIHTVTGAGYVGLTQPPSQRDKTYRTDAHASSIAEMYVICACGRPFVEKRAHLFREIYNRRVSGADVYCPECQATVISRERPVSAVCASCRASFQYYPTMEDRKNLPKVATHCHKPACQSARAAAGGRASRSFQEICSLVLKDPSRP
jgi:hypothetical protein